MSKIADNWRAGSFEILPFHSDQAPLMKAIFEQNRSVASVDPTFGVYDLNIYENLLSELVRENYFLRRIVSGNNEDVGYFHFDFHQVEQGVCWFNLMTLSPEFQGRGVGEVVFSSILEQIEKPAKCLKSGCRCLPQTTGD